MEALAYEGKRYALKYNAKKKSGPLLRSEKFFEIAELPQLSDLCYLLATFILSLSYRESNLLLFSMRIWVAFSQENFFLLSFFIEGEGNAP